MPDAERPAQPPSLHQTTARSGTKRGACSLRPPHMQTPWRGRVLPASSPPPGVLTPDWLGGESPGAWGPTAARMETSGSAHPGGHELQLRHDRGVDQVPVHHQADLHGVGGEGQEVRESTDCKAAGRQLQPPLVAVSHPSSVLGSSRPSQCSSCLSCFTGLCPVLREPPLVATLCLW